MQPENEQHMQTSVKLPGTNLTNGAGVRDRTRTRRLHLHQTENTVSGLQLLCQYSVIMYGPLPSLCN